MTLADGVAAIDGTGRHLLPGLTDMHAHVFTADALVPYLANGVTTVRNMWGGPMALEMKKAVAEGRIPGPRIVTAGQLLDGAPKIWAGSTEVADAAEAAALVAQQAADGYDFVKVYSRLSPEVLDAILAAGAEHGIAVAGHVPQDVPLLHAVQGGMRSAEHFTGMLSAVFADSALPNPDLGSFDPRNHELVKALGRGDLDAAELVDPDKVAQLGADLAAHDFWLVPTIDVMKNFTSIPRPAHPDAFAYLTPADRAIMRMLESAGSAMIDPELQAGETVLYHVRADVLPALHRAGARMLVGTDDSLQHGFAVVDEMETLVETGLTILEVLRAATLGAADYLGERGTFGEVVEGAAADLILVDGNPLEDLGALRRLHGVMRAGTFHDRADLDALLEQLAAKTAAAEAEFDAAPPLPSRGRCARGLPRRRGRCGDHRFGRHGRRYGRHGGDSRGGRLEPVSHHGLPGRGRRRARRGTGDPRRPGGRWLAADGRRRGDGHAGSRRRGRRSHGHTGGHPDPGCRGGRAGAGGHARTGSLALRTDGRLRRRRGGPPDRHRDWERTSYGAIASTSRRTRTPSRRRTAPRRAASTTGWRLPGCSAAGRCVSKRTACLPGEGSGRRRSGAVSRRPTPRPPRPGVRRSADRPRPDAASAPRASRSPRCVPPR